ncbi:hypothetical protein BHYA_0090g00010 [Botrytis hyacinthi]|uniref:Rhamnogalacturonase A/B/Epimerase-like pectate lyase domain-containing protein n=1 Tax=Botrytis hyacinthi TaxID=278943 RepID=A0A4Z1GSG5_9HELO|nr:hypothetical protein BHYA_0090g00010 [Botrytis hyacinthi]
MPKFTIPLTPSTVVFSLFFLRLLACLFSLDSVRAGSSGGQGDSDASPYSHSRSCSYWLEDIKHQGIAAFNPNPPEFHVFRNFKDFGAKGDGSPDDTAAINAAISSGNTCASGSLEKMAILMENETIAEAEEYMEHNARHSVMRWTEEMKKAHAQYHVHRDDRVDYKNRNKRLKKALLKVDPTVEDFDKLRQLGLNWAENSLQELEGRIQFMMNYQQAFERPDSYTRHLKELEGVSNSASKAIRNVKKTRESLILKRGGSSAA